MFRCLMFGPDCGRSHRVSGLPPHLPFDVGCSDVRCSMFRRKSRTRSPSQRCPAWLLFPSMLDVPMFDVRCSAANLAPGRHLNDVPPGSTSLRCWMFRCSMFDVPPQISHPVAISTMSRLAPLPFDVGCSDVRCSMFRGKSRTRSPSQRCPAWLLFPSMLDVPMFDVPPQISHPVAISTMSHHPRRLRPPASLLTLPD
jgi:hypothetical protein